MKRYTQEQCRLVVRALRLGKANLSRKDPRHPDPSKTDYICCAIEGACRASPEDKHAAHLAAEMVMYRLDGYYTAKGWLAGHLPAGVYSRATQQNIQSWRHLWLDKLIKEFAQRAGELFES